MNKIVIGAVGVGAVILIALAVVSYFELLGAIVSNITAI